MSSPTRDPEDRFSEFQYHIDDMLNEGHTNPQIVAALDRLGFKTSIRSLKRYLQRWGCRRPAGTRGVRIGGVTELAEKVNYLFHHTTLNDDSIAARIVSDYGLQTTGRQVRTIRSKFGWLRASTGPSKEANKAATQAQVAQLLDGPGRTFGKAWLVTYLRQIHGYRARRDDVAAAQRALDPEGLALRHSGLRKKRVENYITSGPNFLWCLDGHDKFSQYGNRDLLCCRCILSQDHLVLLWQQQSDCH